MTHEKTLTPVQKYKQSKKGREAARKYYRANKEKLRALGNAWYADNKEKVKQQYEENKSSRIAKVKARREARLVLGLCSNCNVPQTSYSNCYCEKHYFEQRSCSVLGSNKHAQVLKTMFYSNPKCPYTHELLILGSNAVLDHKLPKSRYAHLKHDISNVHWVSEVGNRAKGKMNHVEFTLYLKEWQERINGL